jgi:anti-anti-sigma factor
MRELYTISDEQTVRVIALLLGDSIDEIEFDALNEALRSAIEGHPRVVLDMTSTSYVGSAVLGMLVNVRQRVRAAGGDLVVCGLSARIQQVFAVSSLARLFTVVKTRPDALQLWR